MHTDQPDRERWRLRLTLGALAAVVVTLLASTLIRSAGGISAAPPTAPSSSTSPALTATPSPAPKSTPSHSEGIGIDVARRIPGDPLAIGAVDAPVVLVEYADFRCPFCGVFARDTKPQLMRYVDDGRLRIEFRNLTVFGQESQDAAMAGRAAGQQGKFWQFYDAVYADAPQRGHASLTKWRLIQYAVQVGVPDIEQFRLYMADHPSLEGWNQDPDTREAQQLGMSSTPVFLVNDEPIVGAQPTAVFVEKIERLAPR